LKEVEEAEEVKEVMEVKDVEEEEEQSKRLPGTISRSSASFTSATCFVSLTSSLLPTPV
jgi:hypothetical protein